MVNEMFLSETIRSNYRPDHIYGNQHDRVRIIRHSGNATIVEAMNGKRFPVSTDQLIQTIPDSAPPALPINQASIKPHISSIPKKSKPKNSGSQNQPSLL